jgi:hypothetical protein
MHRRCASAPIAAGRLAARTHHGGCQQQRINRSPGRDRAKRFSNPIRKLNDEIVPVRHLHRGQSLGVDDVVLADQLVRGRLSMEDLLR